MRVKAAAHLLGAGLTLSLGTAAAAGAATSPAGAVPSASNSGVPSVISPSADLGVKPSTAPGYADSIYVNGTVTAGRHPFAVLVQVLQPSAGISIQQVSILDEATGWRRAESIALPASGLRWSAGQLDVKTATLSWAGNASAQKLATKTPWGAINFTLRAHGPVLDYAGTGTFPIGGFPQVEYALPQLRTTGTLNAEGHTYQITGGSLWLDRQWGQLPSFADGNWTWMNFDLPGGDKMAIWDTRSATQNSWATILRPDGSYDLVPVTPLARNASRVWTSPSGQHYPTRWTVMIPSRRTTLTVTAVPRAQNISGPLGTVYEGAAIFSGTYRGHRVSGRTFVEQAGNWNS